MSARGASRRFGPAALAGLLALAVSGILHAQQKDDAPASGASSPARVSAMARHARSIKVTELDKPVALLAEPILRYDDKPRNIFDATLWAWGPPQGRPTAILKVEEYPSRPSDSRWVYGIVALAPERITVKGEDGWEWSSTPPGLDLREIPGAPAPAETEVLRLGQMKQIARRFEVHEDAGPARGRLQLRLMPRPVHRYADASSGLQDGALFGFAYGTNPDLLLVIESHRERGSAPAWRYGLGRLGGGATFVSLDGRAVRTEPAADIPARRETYMNRFQRDLDSP